MTRFFLLLIAISVSCFRPPVAGDSTHSIRERVEPSLSVSVTPAKRNRHVPAPRVRQKLVHPLFTLRRRVALVTKPGATLAAGLLRVSTHATSIAAPRQGGPSLLTTRLIRTSSIATTLPTTSSTATSTTSTATSTPTTAGTTTTTCTGTCPFGKYALCYIGASYCSSYRCQLGLSCQSAAGIPSCQYYANCCQ